MPKTNYLSRNPKETALLAEFLAQEILKTWSRNKALVVGFTGELGSGKTTFIKALVRALGVKTRITSPTFIIFRRFEAPRLKYYKNIFHFDAYRLKSAEELKKLNLTKVFTNSRNLVLVEWAEKVKSALPKGTIWIELKHGQKPNERHLTFNRR